MDSIDPIPPSASPLSQLPVQRLERISRERDRPAREGEQRRRRRQAPPRAPERAEPEDEDEQPHIDVRA